MADYTDANGNPIKITTPQYTDVNGNPIKLTSPTLSFQGPPPGANTGIPGEHPYDISYAPLIVPNLLSAIGGMTGGPVGATAGSMFGEGLKNLAPSVFSATGTAPDVGTSLGQIGTDYAIQGLVPSAVEGMMNLGKDFKGTLSRLIANKFVSRFPSVRDALETQMGQNVVNRLLYPETGILESAASNAANSHQGLLDAYEQADKGSPEELAARKIYANAFGSNSIGQKLLNLSSLNPGEVQTQGYKNITQQALRDVSQVRNFKLATGEPFTIEQLAQKKLIEIGYSPATKTFDPDKILNELDGGNNEIYTEAIRPQAMTSFRNLLEQAQKEETTSTTNRILNYSKNRLIFATAAGYIGGHEGLIGAGGLILTDAALGKIARSPEIAQLALKAMKTGAGAPEAGLVQRSLLLGLRGAEIYYTAPDGREEKAIIGQNGQLQTPR